MSEPGAAAILAIACIAFAALTCCIQWWYRQSGGNRLRRVWVVVTGSDRGIGAEVVRQLAKEGARVIALFRAEPPPDFLTAWCRDGAAIRCDVTCDTQVAAAVARVAELVRDEGVFALVNNAGVHRGFLADWNSVADHSATADVNYLGAVRVTLALLPQLTRFRAAASGRTPISCGQWTGARVINIASITALTPYPAASAYGASKAALLSWTRSARQDLIDRGVQCTAVCPGAVRTAILQHTVTGVREHWQRLPPGTRQLYGGGADAYADALIAQLSLMGAGALSVPDLASTVIKLLRSRSMPAVSVVSGWDPPSCMMWLPLPLRILLSKLAMQAPCVPSISLAHPRQAMDVLRDKLVRAWHAM